MTVARYPLGLRLPAGPFLSMPAPVAAGKIVLEENKHGQRRVTARRARPRCLVANRTRAPCAESQAAWGSWVSRAQYPGALAAPTRSPVSAPAPVPEPVGAGARSRRHVPHHLENEQAEREQQLCTRALSQAAWCSWVSLAQYPVRERGGSDEPACSTSNTSTSRGPGELLVPHLLLSRTPSRKPSR